jgi:esterase/lipase superfamily enzyme
MNILNQEIDIKAIGRFLANHFKFTFTVVWFSYLAISGRFEIMEYLENWILNEIKYEMNKNFDLMDNEFCKRFDKSEKLNDQRHNDVIDSHSKIYKSINSILDEGKK